MMQDPMYRHSPDIHPAIFAHIFQLSSMWFWREFVIVHWQDEHSRLRVRFRYAKQALSAVPTCTKNGED